MKGYKVFNSDWTCRGFQYEIGKTYKMYDKPVICLQGFHFCKNLKDCFYYYPFSKDIKIAEVEAFGDLAFSVDDSITKVCTNRIKIVREICFEDLIITTVPETGTYVTNYYIEPSDMVAFVKNHDAIGIDIFVRDSVKIISIDKEELEDELDELLSWSSYMIFHRYKYTFEYQKIIDIEEKPVMGR